MKKKPYLAHVVFQTEQLDAMRDWYCAVLGARTVHEGHGLCFLTFDEEHHRIALIQPPHGVEKRNPAAAPIIAPLASAARDTSVCHG